MRAEIERAEIENWVASILALVLVGALLSMPAIGYHLILLLR